MFDWQGLSRSVEHVPLHTSQAARWLDRGKGSRISKTRDRNPTEGINSGRSHVAVKWAVLSHLPKRDQVLTAQQLDDAVVARGAFVAGLAFVADGKLSSPEEGRMWILRALDAGYVICRQTQTCRQTDRQTDRQTRTHTHTHTHTHTSFMMYS